MPEPKYLSLMNLTTLLSVGAMETMLYVRDVGH
jgi:hypothetical protein